MRKITDILKEKEFTLSIELVPPRNGEGKEEILSKIGNIKDCVIMI